MKLLDLRSQILRVIPHEKSAVVSQFGVRHAAIDDLIIEIPDGVVTQEATARDHAKTDAGVPEILKHPVAIDAPVRVENDGERKTGTLAVLSLSNEALIAGKQFLE